MNQSSWSDSDNQNKTDKNPLTIEQLKKNTYIKNDSSRLTPAGSRITRPLAAHVILRFQLLELQPTERNMCSGIFAGNDT